jgi:hypothetical protein
MSISLTGPWAVVKQLSHVEEAVFGTTPASPTTVNDGLINEIAETTDITATKYRALGNADVAAGLKCGELYSFSLKYNPVDLGLANYGLKLDTGLTGTNGKSLSMVYSYKLSGTENYVIFRGTKTDSVDIDVAPDGLDVSQNFICKSISVPAAAHGLGASTIFAAASGSTPLCGTDATGFTWNSVTYNPVSFKVSVSQNLEARRTVGQQQIVFLTATNRDITFDLTISSYITTLQTDAVAMTSRTASIMIGSATLTFTGAYLINYSKTLSAGGNATQEESYTGFSKTLTVT